ncbi:16S rRNA (adenine(1518)-N(6)/adenine(1519)-N(6))-dimethyltransferase [Streptococcus azizii]|uniref:Ribosomal RNA small subunit methyltransferase A n=2 Tax=Streptococcus TaxID=1301 RepID=A0AB36JSW0_9STRE|nr:16S rRNA (adenine(1518)-N(6)/adenine(1519)-N(6))-dimethyltransferase RsmA [Streptococcus sp. 19428wD3_AN2]ONK27100.1 16S rRNA (adenine(1518)-N(6)/adenine(1519)-N(6))-dimethyltransferase [Streptococcus azizii]ONK28453.1 16S rRNA (adenine(1518)-N(6)/adenine(1519)-N(6))-dimethyltransferase [Streptococcus azizii]ONK28533.1 16S rRNA (adenine(1518)-N(6)/adenine(1519)-N(6))-dimethyltransferase [Streptococcus azizii]TFU83140.1 16S rRNA (adenine(1518)-N(6)/adenine(1519)-N(6))-dimethyltransferase RsmA
MKWQNKERTHMRIADYSVTKSVLERHGFTFKKSFGQNFLTDTNILQKIVDTAEIDKSVNVIEIGPGIGALTEFLAETAAEVMAFEIDDRLIPILADTLRDFDNVQVVNQDILKADLQRQIQQFQNPDLPIKVVANLPYYITTPILMHLIESKIPFTEFVVMMQKEVADRISAEPNTKAYGSLSIAVQYYMTAKIAFIVPRTVFVPAPNVDSAILKMVRRDQPLVSVQDEDFLFDVVKSSFVHRRKTLWNNLTNRFGKAEATKEKLQAALEMAELEASVRGEALTLEDFARLSDSLLQVGVLAIQ